MKKAKMFLLLILAVISFGIIGCSNQLERFSNAYITVDINPSIEIITNDKGRVVQVNPLNDDAYLMLVDTDFKGETIENVIEKIVTLALELGYLDFDQANEIVISSLMDSERLQSRLNEKIQKRIDKVSEAKGIQLKIRNNQELTAEQRAKAEELGINYGKLRIIEEAMKFDPALTYETAATMEIKDLNKIIIPARQEMRNLMTEDLRQEYFTKRAEFRTNFRIKLVEEIYQAMVNADDQVFATLISETTTTVEEIKGLYYEYLQALLNTNPSEVNEEVVTNVLARLNEDEEFNNLNSRQQQIMNLIQTLRQQLAQENRPAEKVKISNQISSKIVELNHNTRELNMKVNQFLKQTENEFEGYVFGYSFGEEGIKLTARFNFNAEFEQIRKTYCLLFKDLGIELNELEKLFFGDVEEIMNEFKNQFKNEIEEFVNGIKARVEEMVQEKREQKEAIREANKR